MNFYKKIIRSQELRLKIMSFFSFLPDPVKIHFQYLVKTGRIANIRKPKRYSEKIQWYKLNYRISLITQCSDKFAVREYVESKGLGVLLNDLYAVYDRAEDIDFSSLPSSFAMKVNNGSGKNLFVTDISQVDTESLRKTADKWLKRKVHSSGGEWCYDNIPPKIVFEKLLPRNVQNDLPDYKFFCFNGEPKCLYTMIDYIDDHKNGKLGFFDMDFKQLPYCRADFMPITEPIERPKNFDKMVEYARILSKDFPHVRVDFYDIDGKIIFGELTFSCASGYLVFKPDEFDMTMGDWFSLPEKTIEKQ